MNPDSQPELRIVEAVLFDVDGVVVDSELLHLETFNEVLKPLGITISREDWLRRFLGKGSTYIMGTVFAEHGVSQDPKPWIERRRQIYQRRVAQGALRMVPGFPEFYDSVLGARLPIAFVSTGHPTNINAALRSLGMAGKHPIIDATQVQHLKPHPEAYLLAARRLHVSPRHCIAFEDSPAGVAAAKAANMHCVALTTTRSPAELSQADLTIPNFEGWTIETLLARLRLKPHPPKENPQQM